MTHKQLLDRIREAALQLGGDAEYPVMFNIPEDAEPFDQLSAIDVYPDNHENIIGVDLG
jgi:hypothetical protein